MDEIIRQKNEKEFESWTERRDGSRIYSFEISGKLGWKAKYLKEVDSEEVTLRFGQEVYDENDILRELHEKYPLDRGHKKM